MVLDAPAINLTMGHADPSMGAVYRQKIDDARVQRVCEYVRTWLFGDPADEQDNPATIPMRRVGG